VAISRLVTSVDGHNSHTWTRTHSTGYKSDELSTGPLRFGKKEIVKSAKFDIPVLHAYLLM